MSGLMPRDLLCRPMLICLPCNGKCRSGQYGGNVMPPASGPSTAIIMSWKGGYGVPAITRC